MSDLIGHTFGSYRIVEKLGTGGMAEVYKAFQPRLERYVALKFIRADLMAEPNFFTRFEREARVLAQLNHPNIVHVYDFGEDNGQPYLAMEYVAGKSLADWLTEQGRPPLANEALHILQSVSAALDAAHAQGIIHRDVKPANILLTPDRRALLSDFGLSRMSRPDTTSDSAATSGTPAYMPPEQIVGDTANLGPASDVYALGVVAYEMLVGRVPFIHQAGLPVLIQHLQMAPPAPRELNPDVPEAVEPLLLKALAKAPEERFATCGAFVRALQDALAEPTTAGQVPNTWPMTLPDDSPAPGESPFKGLQYFDEADAENFFGREALTEKIAARLSQLAHIPRPGEMPTPRFFTVVGASGSGKSSLVRAGVIPILRRQTDRQIYLLTPTTDPLEALALSLTRGIESVTAATTLMDDLAQDARSLHLFLRRLAPNAKPLLLVIDQFEELFTLCHHEAKREAFIDNLLYACRADSAVTALITLRADFYAHCAPYTALREVLSTQQDYIGPMTRGELRAAIERPADKGSWALEAGLVDLLLQDVGANEGRAAEPGALPLLSHALLETWQRRRGRTLTFSGYLTAGGVRGALAQTAETVYQRFSPTEQELARDIFLRLTELGEGTQDTRRRATLDELSAHPPTLVQTVLQALTASRLIIAAENTLEVAHEALIREWPTLRKWLDEDREALRVRRALTDAAQEWQKLNRDEGVLYRGAKLMQAKGYAESHPNTLSTLEAEFVRAAEEQANREEVEREAQKQRELEAIKKIADFEKQRSEFLIHAKRRSLGITLAFQARFYLESDFNLTLLLAIEANNPEAVEVAIEGREILATCLQLYPRLITMLHGHLNTVSRIVFSPEGRELVSIDLNQAIYFWDLSQPATPLLRDQTPHIGRVENIVFQPNGTRLATFAKNEIKLWDSKSVEKSTNILLPSDVVPKKEETFTIPNTGGVTIPEELVEILFKKHEQERYENSLLPKFQEITPTVEYIALSPNGKLLACTTADKFFLWNINSDPPQLIKAATQAKHFTQLVFSPNSKLLIAESDYELYAWDLSQTNVPNIRHEKLLHLRDLSSFNLLALIFNPEAEKLVVLGANGTLYIRRLTRPVVTSPPPPLPVKTSEQHTWSKLIAVGTTIAQSIWRRIRSVVTPSATHLAVPREIASQPTVQSVTSNLSIEIDSQRAWVLNDHQKVQSATFSHDTKAVALGYQEGTIGLVGLIGLWDISELSKKPVKLGQLLAGKNIAVTQVALSPDRKILASTSSKNKAIWLWDISDFNAPSILGKTLRQHSQAINCLTLSPNGQIFAFSSRDRLIHLWRAGDLINPTPVCKPLKGHPTLITSLAFSPDGRFLVSGDFNSDLCLWDVSIHAEPKLIGRLRHDDFHRSQITCLKFSPDGRFLVSGDNAGVIILWDVSHSKTPVRLHHAIFKAPVVAAGFYSDKIILTTTEKDEEEAGLKLYVWNALQLTEPVQQTSIHSADEVISAAFSPNHQLLAVGGRKGEINIWDISQLTTPISTGWPLNGHLSPVNTLTFNTQAESLISSDETGTIMFWSLVPDVSRARIMAGRNFTKTEWKRFFGDEPYRKTCPEWPEGE